MPRTMLLRQMSAVNPIPPHQIRCGCVALRLAWRACRAKERARCKNHCADPQPKHTPSVSESPSVSPCDCLIPSALSGPSQKADGGVERDHCLCQRVSEKGAVQVAVEFFRKARAWVHNIMPKAPCVGVGDAVS